MHSEETKLKMRESKLNWLKDENRSNNKIENLQLFEDNEKHLEHHRRLIKLERNDKKIPEKC